MVIFWGPMFTAGPPLNKDIYQLDSTTGWDGLRLLLPLQVSHFCFFSRWLPTASLCHGEGDKASFCHPSALASAFWCCKTYAWVLWQVCAWYILCRIPGLRSAKESAEVKEVPEALHIALATHQHCWNCKRQKQNPLPPTMRNSDLK